MKIIGLAGYKRSGKTTAANFLVADHGYVRVSFASVIKDMIKAMGCPPEYITGDRKEEVWPPIKQTARYAMQRLGTEFGRQLLHQDVWVDLLMHRIDSGECGDKVVIDDVRFINEGEAIKSRGGLMARISRPDCEGDQHESERYAARIKVDYTFYNVGDLDLMRGFMAGIVAQNKENK